MDEHEMKLKPLGWGASVAIFLLTAIMLRITHYSFVTAIKTVTGKPYLFGYLIGWVSTMFLFFLASLIAYKLDGCATTLQAFTARFRLDKMERADWVWAFAMIVLSIVFIFVLSFSAGLLKSVPFFIPHPLFPPDMVDMTNNLRSGYLFEMPLQGQWWLIVVYFLGWLLNILGEEFWYRGWMLPRQEVAFGKFAWIINGLMFNFQHTYQPWNLLAMLPGSLFVSYAVQRQRKTWMSIIWHGFVNSSLLIFVIQGVIV